MTRRLRRLLAQRYIKVALIEGRNAGFVINEHSSGDLKIPPAQVLMIWIVMIEIHGVRRCLRDSNI